MPKNQTDSVTQLQNKHQQLQTQMLLMKTTGTDSMNDSSEMQKRLEAELETISAKLRTAKTNHNQATEQIHHTQLDKQTADTKSSYDLYTSEKTDTASFGLYRIKKYGEKSYSISFTPYSKK